MTEIPVLILAAGNSSRMGGRAKQLLPWGDTTLLGHAIQQAKKVTGSVLVLLGSQAKAIGESIEGQAEILVNPQWEKGMGGSISQGTEYLLATNPVLKGILIMVGDQPFLDASHLGELLDKFQYGNSKIVCTSYGEGLGVPAVFDGSLAGEFLRLDPQYGAKGIIEKYREQVLRVSPKGREGDIDTMEAYHRALASSRGFFSD